MALMAVTLLAYLPALQGAFLFDDNLHIYENKPVLSPGGLVDIWFKPGATPQYYPLTFTLFWLGYRLWGLHTLGYHLLNVLLHGTAAILLAQVLQRLKVRGAWLAGAIFALHPVCVMSVAWMTELKNTLSATMALGAAWAYLRATKLGVYAKEPETAETPLDGRFYVLSLVLFQLALFAKSAVSFLPVTLLLITWWRDRSLNWRTLWPVLPMLGLTIADGLLTIFVERHSGGASGAPFQIPFIERVLISGRSFWFYLGKLFFPYQLTFLYERWTVSAGVWWQYLYPAAAAAALAALWWWRGRLGKGLFVALLHFFVATSLLILIVVPYFTVFSFVSDHWQYFGCLSVMAVVAAGIMRGLDSFENGNLPLRSAACGALLLSLFVMTWRQSSMYANAATLWSATIDRNPTSAQAQNRYGDILFQSGDIDGALKHFEIAVTLPPEDAETRYNLGETLAKKGRLDEAIAQFRKALEIEPGSGLAHNGLGQAFAAQGKYEDAIAQFQQALAARPGLLPAQLNYGNALLHTGRKDEAVAFFQRVLDDEPDNFAAHVNLGGVLAQTGQLDGAINQFQQALALNPHDAMTHANLGTALLQKGQLDAAVVEFQKAAQIEPGNYGVRDNLGILLYQERRLDDAITQFKTAFELNPQLPSARDHLNRIAWMLAASPVASVRDGARSLTLAQELVRLTAGADPSALATEAAAYAETGKYAEAATTAGQARDLAAQQGNAAIEDALAPQLEAYRARQPFRDTNISAGTAQPPPGSRPTGGQ